MLNSITIFEPAIDKEYKENQQGYVLTDVDEILPQEKKAALSQALVSYL